MPHTRPLGFYLFDQLKRRGVKRIFGIPGDFAVSLFNAFERYGALDLITLSHEPSVGFAADVSARATQGLSVAMVTYGAGGFNMLNPVGCAYSERSPLVIISGAPGTRERDGRVVLHHQVKGIDTQFEIYKRMTEAAAALENPATAGREINRVLDTALLRAPRVRSHPAGPAHRGDAGERGHFLDAPDVCSYRWPAGVGLRICFTRTCCRLIL